MATPTPESAFTLATTINLAPPLWGVLLSIGILLVMISSAIYLVTYNIRLTHFAVSFSGVAMLMVLTLAGLVPEVWLIGFGALSVLSIFIVDRAWNPLGLLRHVRNYILRYVRLIEKKQEKE